MPDLDLDRLKDVPLELWKRCADVAATMAPEAPCVIELRAALTPRMSQLCNEPVAPDPAPAPSEREQALQREVEELKRDRVAIDKHSAGLIEELERVRCRNRFLESIISQVAAEAQRPSHD